MQPINFDNQRILATDSLKKYFNQIASWVILDSLSYYSQSYSSIIIISYVCASLLMVFYEDYLAN